MHVPQSCTLSKGPSQARGHALFNTDATHIHAHTQKQTRSLVRGVTTGLVRRYAHRVLHLQAAQAR